MQRAVPAGVGTMAAILGLEGALVERLCMKARELIMKHEAVEPANFNAPGQVVIAGTIAGVEKAVALLKEDPEFKGGKAIPLQVSAPFHCSLMKPAETRLEPELRALRVSTPRVPVVANVDANPKTDGAASIDALVRQISSPVQWDALVRRLASEGVTTYVEVGPGTVLGGLVKKIHSDARILNFGSPEQLDAVLAACSI